jgi:hypothetical protein
MNRQEQMTQAHPAVGRFARRMLKVVVVGGSLLAGPGGAADLINATYRMALQDDGSVLLSCAGVQSQRFEPCFTILYSATEPKRGLNWGEFKDPRLKGMYNIENWSFKRGKAIRVIVDPNQHVDDGSDPLTDRDVEAGMTCNLFKAGRSVALRATKGVVDNNRMIWSFSENNNFKLEAEIELPRGSEAPKLTWRLTPTKAGWWSVGYTGAPEVEPDKMDEMWQPMIWQEKRFPEDCFMTSAFRCPLPTTLVTLKGVTCGVVAEPDTLPFQPMPKLDNSQFGVAVRNPKGMAQPMLFAPVLGGTNSLMREGATHVFSCRLVVCPGGCTAAYEQIARSLFGFRDYRENFFCSLNTTLENMVAYGMGEYSRFNSELRGCSYDTDMPGSVKNISSLHPVGMALVTDDEAIYWERGLPMIEFALSREKFLFTTKLGEKGSQSASSILNGPGGQVSEFAALYQMSNRRMPFLLDAATELMGKTRILNLDAPVPGNIWPNALALYHATGDSQWLKKAVEGADQYLARRLAKPQNDFQDPDSRGMFFWTSYVPNWSELQLLYEATGEKRFLDAAVRGARQHAQCIWMCPAIPDANILVNEGGVAPAYRPRVEPRIKLLEEIVPAWRMSEIGLSPESAPTCKGHRGVFLACHAPWMLRLGLLAHDTFLHDIARSAVVGRYANFPGYHINAGRTTLFEKPDFPLRSMKELNGVTSLHYNHVWAQIGMVFDYLVSDAFYKSKGQIVFPGHYAEGYAYVQTKVYGDRPGRIYDKKDAWLWMPKGLLHCDNVQVNTVVARGENALYLVLLNQSQQAVTPTVTLNKTRVDVSGKHVVNVWKQNVKTDTVRMVGGAIQTSIAAEGITVLEITGLRIETAFQKKVLAAASVPPKKGSVELSFGGGSKAFLLSFGPELTSAYVYTKATYETVRSITLHYRNGDTWKTVSDTAYPYEFTVPLTSGDSSFQFFLEAVNQAGTVTKSETAVLLR